VTSAYQGRGSRLYLSGDAANYARVAQLQSFDFDGGQVEMLDATDISSAGFHRKLPGPVDWGQLSYEGVLDPRAPSQASLGYLRASRGLGYFRIALPDGTWYAFQGYVVKHAPAKVNYAKAITFSGAIEIDGPVQSTNGGAFQWPAFQWPAFQSGFA
jgi:hypothetical protein